MKETVGSGASPLAAVKAFVADSARRQRDRWRLVRAMDDALDKPMIALAIVWLVLLVLAKRVMLVASSRRLDCTALWQWRPSLHQKAHPVRVEPACRFVPWVRDAPSFGRAEACIG